MGDKPIVLTAPEVRAVLTGRKTQKRVVLKPQPREWQALVIDILPPSQEEDGSWGQVETVWSGPLIPGMCEPDHEVWHPIKHHRIGDRLYVCEHWRTIGAAGMQDSIPPRDLEPQAVWYAADGKAPFDCFAGKHRQGMHMPRWASRITLTVTEVRVQRLQDISEDDAIADGIERVAYEGPDPAYAEAFGWKDYSDHPHSVVPFNHQLPVRSYATLWESINGPGSWDANPWVAAYRFEPTFANIDKLKAAA